MKENCDPMLIKFCSRVLSCSIFYGFIISAAKGYPLLLDKNNLPGAYADHHILALPPRRNEPSQGSPDVADGARSGGARRTCILSEDVLPRDNHIAHLVSPPRFNGYTAQPTPTLWLHTPYQILNNSPVELEIKKSGDGSQVTINKQLIEIEPGIFGISLPTNLEPNVSYHWYFRVYCNDPMQRNPPDFVIGGILYSPTESGGSEQNWYDDVTDIINAYQQNPNDRAIQAEWDELLRLVELDDSPYTEIRQTIQF